MQKVTLALFGAVVGFAQIRLQPILADLPADEVYTVAVSRTGRIAFAWCRDHQKCEIYIRSSATAPSWLLFKGELFLSVIAPHLEWSPDGAWLAYSQPLSRFDSAFYLIPTSGENSRRLSDTCTGGMAWAANSRALVVHVRDTTAISDECDLVAVGLDGQRLGAIARRAGAPSLASDGRMIAFSRRSRLIVRSLDAALSPLGQERIVAEAEPWVAGIAWISGGTELLYRVAGNQQLRRVLITNGAKPRMVSGLDAKTEIRVLAGGSGAPILARAAIHGGVLWQLDLARRPGGALKIRDLSQAEVRHIGSPDGQLVAYVLEGGLWVTRLDGSDARLLARPREVVANPRWSPDGHWIAFTGAPAVGNGDLRSRPYVVQTSTGQIRRLRPEREDLEFSSWSGDGQWLYVTREAEPDVSAKREIWKLNIVSSELRKVGIGMWPQESRDGKWLYYAESPLSWLLLAPVGGSREEKLGIRATYGFVAGINGVYVADNSTISKLDTRTLTARVLASMGSATESLALREDESTLFFETAPTPRAAWMVLDGLR